jgi:hypothetical protein
LVTLMPLSPLWRFLLVMNPCIEFATRIVAHESIHQVDFA